MTDEEVEVVRNAMPFFMGRILSPEQMKYAASECVRALDAHRGLGPEGTHVVVPREPTEKMLQALFVLPDMVGGAIIRHSIDKLPDAYRAMLVAAVEAD